MTRPAFRREESSDLGFTLLELLIALALLALALTLVAPSFDRSLGGLGLRTTAYELAGHLRSARAAAQAGNVERVLTIDIASRQYWAEGVVPRRPLPRLHGIELIIPESERLGAAAGRIRFFPDGSASGGRILLIDGRATAAVSVDWLKGDVRVQWRQ